MRVIDWGTKAMVAVLAVSAVPADAAVDLYIYEDGNDLVAVATGSLDVSALPGSGVSFPEGGTLAFGGDSFLFNAVTGPTQSFSFNTRIDLDFSAPLETATVTGTSFGIDVSRFGAGLLVLPTGYRSGDPVRSTAVFRNASLASASIDRGTFVIDILRFQTPVDRVTLRVGEAPPVPEPATWATMLAGFALAGGAMRRRRAALAA